FALHAGYFIYQTSFVIDGQRWFSLFDDAMVSMRYAKNLADGRGLVWNPGGPRVEGFTNPLWVGFMALPHLLHIAESKISLFVQTGAPACLLLNLYPPSNLARLLDPGDSPWPLAAVALTAFYYPLNNWSLQGMEVAPLTLLTTTCVWLLLRARQ